MGPLLTNGKIRSIPMSIQGSDSRALYLALALKTQSILDELVSLVESGCRPERLENSLRSARAIVDSTKGEGNTESLEAGYEHARTLLSAWSTDELTEVETLIDSLLDANVEPNTQLENAKRIAGLML